MNFILITLIILTILLFFVGRVSYLSNPFALILSIILILVLSVLSFIFPFFSFLFAIVISSIIVLISFPSLFPFGIKNTISEKLLLFLYETSLLDLLSLIHIQFFFVSKIRFLIRTLLLGLFCCFHIMFSRWYSYNSIKSALIFENSHYFNSNIFILLFLGVAISYFRFILNFTLFIIPLALNYRPDLLSPSILYILEGGDNNSNFEESSNINKNNSNQNTPEKKFSFINVNSTRAHYRNTYYSTNTPVFKYVGICVGFCAMTAAAFSAYYQSVDHVEMKKQTEYAKQQAYDTRREADAAAVDSGLLTKEEYWRRHPRDADFKPEPKNKNK